jgi:hypothetical protein
MGGIRLWWNHLIGLASRLGFPLIQLPPAGLKESKNFKGKLKCQESEKVPQDTRQRNESSKL